MSAKIRAKFAALRRATKNDVQKSLPHNQQSFNTSRRLERRYIVPQRCIA
jgi:hypothetical protein